MKFGLGVIWKSFLFSQLSCLMSHIPVSNVVPNLSPTFIHSQAELRIDWLYPTGLDAIIDSLLSKLQKDLDVDEKITSQAGKAFFTFQEQHQDSRKI